MIHTLYIFNFFFLFYRQSKMLVTKEQAFMESLSAASIMHTLLLYCFQGKFHQCKCFKEREACVSQCSQTFNMKSLLKFGVKVIDTFLKQKSENRVRIHNRRIGIKVCLYLFDDIYNFCKLFK